MKTFVRHVSVNCNCGANFRISKTDYDAGVPLVCKKSCNANKAMKERRSEPRDENFLYQRGSSSSQIWSYYD